MLEAVMKQQSGGMEWSSGAAIEENWREQNKSKKEENSEGTQRVSDKYMDAWWATPLYAVTLLHNCAFRVLVHCASLVLTAEAAGVLGVLGNFDLLDLLTERSSIASSVLSDDSNFLSATTHGGKVCES